MNELRGQLGDVAPDNAYAGSASIAKPNGADAPSDDADVPIYSIDGVVRRAAALQLTAEARLAGGEDD